ncbi:MAG: pyridoxamine kinase [Clostridia bacterium]|nr:pyridoxamine kinase [Clostridia bacterium]
MMQKRVAAINDLSCLGKCSLTLTLPIFAAAQIETCPLPTAVFSAHTGGFSGNVLHDLTDELLPIAKHWNREGVRMDAIYTGYLCSARQINPVLQAIGLLSHENTLFVTDPVMADHGRLYCGFHEDFPEEMLRLCRTADILTPNITEAALLTKTPYVEALKEKPQAMRLAERLYDLTGATAILTGVSGEHDTIGAIGFDGRDFFSAFTEKLPGAFHGTGDVFTTSLTAALVRGWEIVNATRLAVDFTADCLRETIKTNAEERFGLRFESRLADLSATFRDKEPCA